MLRYAWINSWCLPSVITPVGKSLELTQCKLFFANPCADTDILQCICPGKKSSLGTQDFLPGGHLVQNMTQYFFLGVCLTFFANSKLHKSGRLLLNINFSVLTVGHLLNDEVGAFEAIIIRKPKEVKLSLEIYADASYGGEGVRLQTGVLMTLRNGSVGWYSWKQDIIALSITEVEYIVDCKGAKGRTTYKPRTTNPENNQ